MHCRSCAAPLRGCEVNGDGGCAISFAPTAACTARLAEAESADGAEAHWQCRYLDGYPCTDCGTVDLAVADLRVLLECEGTDLPRSKRACPACGVRCRGPQHFDVDGAPGIMLAFLAPQFGAPLRGHLCPSCGRVWPSLYPDDDEARRELADRFPDAGPCPACAKGRLRVTRLDAPHSGFVSLYGRPEPGPDGNVRGGATPQRVAGLAVAVCDACGEASPRIAAEEPRRTRRRRGG